jgi:hypothetical protein
MVPWQLVKEDLGARAAEHQQLTEVHVVLEAGVAGVTALTCPSPNL